MMHKNERKLLGTFDVSVVWLGAGISVAEIVTGAEFGSLGFSKGLLAIVIGHVIGGLLFLLAGLISAKTGSSAMEAARKSFGERGASLFALLNVLQLIGWISILNFDGALAAAGIGLFDIIVWSIVIGVLIAVFAALDLNKAKHVSRIAVVALVLLTLFICIRFLGDGGQHAAPLGEGVTFGAAVELAVAMPLSWLPLIGDYTSRANKPVAASVGSTIGYSVISIWMYAIGLMLAIGAQSTDISVVINGLGLKTIGLIVIVFSTVTTNFVAAHSCGVSFKTMLEPFGIKVSAVAAGVGAAILSIFGSIFLPLEDITGFLYLIGSVFVPMIAILATDHFFLRRDVSRKSFDLRSLLLWIVGFAIYRLMMGVETPLGVTLPSMVVIVVICLVCGAIERTIGRNKRRYK